MQPRKTTLAVVLMMAAAVVPATAYHIDGGLSDVDPNLTSADWQLTSGGAIICESNGAHSSRNAGAGARHGVGGLCTTGENDATGVAEPGNSAPAKGTYVQLDACGQVTLARNNFTPGPYGSAGDCKAATNVTFDAEIGVYFCTVEGPQALYYDRLYAWWSYDDNEPTGGHGDPHYNASDVAGNVENTVNVTNDPAFDNEDAWHGHVAVFIDASSTTLTQGSMVTSLAGDGSAVPNKTNCGSSPSAAVGGLGPVFVGDES